MGIRRDDENELNELLGSVAHMWESHSKESFDEATKSWQSTLAESRIKLPDRKTTGYWALINKFVFDPLQSLSAWFRSKVVNDRALQNRTIPRLIQTGLIEISSDGEIKLHSAPITPEVANLLSFLIAVTFSFSAIWILFIADASWGLIWQSLAVGLVIGTIISALHDFSYNKENILNYLKSTTD